MQSSVHAPFSFCMTQDETRLVAREIRRLYWFIRVYPRGRFDALRRRYYRRIAAEKKRLLDAGVSKREVLNLVACCRSRRCRRLRCRDCPHLT
ncbi:MULTISPECIES: hypothetical protein [unclassified Cupriavidus]|uniref:hypothetical protein n=1 Tax=unclassified Cupriavidus TaxID=2640874 RepID=UPI00313F0DDA